MLTRKALRLLVVMCGALNDPTEMLSLLCTRDLQVRYHTVLVERFIDMNYAAIRLAVFAPLTIVYWYAFGEF